jgi:hypothetical protein
MVASATIVVKLRVVIKEIESTEVVVEMQLGWALEIGFFSLVMRREYILTVEVKGDIPSRGDSGLSDTKSGR